MQRRFATIWFPFLLADYNVRRCPKLKNTAFVLAAPDHGRLLVKAVSPAAQQSGIHPNMVVADCRAIHPELTIIDYKEGTEEKLLKNLGEWSIRFSPVVAVDLPDGLIIETTGCTHLWGGEQHYLEDYLAKMKSFGYTAHGCIASTIGTAWGVSRYGGNFEVIGNGSEFNTLLKLPAPALRLDEIITDRLDKLGLHAVKDFINMPRPSLRRRFGPQLLKRLNHALGVEEEFIKSLLPSTPYLERLPCLEPICTATGIGLALKQLLEKMCERFKKEGIGLRKGIFKTYRVDGKIQQLEIGTSRASRNAEHLFKLFEIKIDTLEPGLGIELFMLEAPKAEPVTILQEAMWDAGNTKDDTQVAELVDRIAGKTGMNTIHRYLPAEQHWPERSIKITADLQAKPETQWRYDLPRPLHLLSRPELIKVAAPIPDYPPMLFRYKGNIHKVVKAEGPERIEQEWWVQQGLYRDYYCVEDEDGSRFWLFRSGDYEQKNTQWFVHGFFP